MEGYVYCLSNPAMPGLLKVGFTTNKPTERMLQLYSTGVPLPFELEFAKLVKNPYEKEQTLHKLLERYEERVNPKREFFRLDKHHLKLFFDLMDGEYVHKEIEVKDVPIVDFLNKYRYCPEEKRK